MQDFAVRDVKACRQLNGAGKSHCDIRGESLLEKADVCAHILTKAADACGVFAIELSIEGLQFLGIVREQLRLSFVIEILSQFVHGRAYGVADEGAQNRDRNDGLAHEARERAHRRIETRDF